MSGRTVGHVVVELVDGVAVMDWLGHAVTRDRAVDLLAQYGQEWPDADFRLARIVIEADEP